MKKRNHLNDHKPKLTKSQAQHQRNPLLNVRLPRALYTQLQEAAKADSRTLADWLRLNLARLLPVDRNAELQMRHIRDSYGIETPIGSDVQEPTEPSK